MKLSSSIYILSNAIVKYGKLDIPYNLYYFRVIGKKTLSLISFFAQVSIKHTVTVCFSTAIECLWIIVIACVNIFKLFETIFELSIRFVCVCVLLLTAI